MLNERTISPPEPEEPLFPDFTDEDFDTSSGRLQAAAIQIPLKRDEPLWFLTDDDESLKLVIGESRSRYEDTLVTKAAHWFWKKDYEKSLLAWQKVEAFRSSAKEVRFEEMDGCTRCCYHLGRYEEALQYAQRLVTISPNDAGAWYLKAQIELKLSTSWSFSGAVVDAEEVSRYSGQNDRNLDDQEREAAVSMIRSLLCGNSPLGAFVTLAMLYRAMNKALVVRFIVFRGRSHMRRTRRPEMSALEMAVFDALERWCESVLAEQVPEGEMKSIFHSREHEEALEWRYFGLHYSKVLTVAPRLAGGPDVSDENSLAEDDMAEIRDPSRM